MQKRILAVLLVTLVAAGVMSAQFGGVVYDPTNYHNALLRYYQLQQHLVELQQTYTKVLAHYNLAVEMARSVRNMPARYRAAFSRWRNATAADRYGNTALWIAGINSGADNGGYGESTVPLFAYDVAHLGGMDADELSRVRSQYASVELSDGASVTAMSALGAIRANARSLEAQTANLESDSFSSDPRLNSEVSVLNKINAASVLTLRSLQDSNKLLGSLLEQQVIAAKQQREAAANAINADILRRRNLLRNLSQVTDGLARSLETFRMP